MWRRGRLAQVDMGGGKVPGGEEDRCSLTFCGNSKTWFRRWLLVVCFSFRERNAFSCSLSITPCLVRAERKSSAESISSPDCAVMAKAGLTH